MDMVKYSKEPNNPNKSCSTRDKDIGGQFKDECRTGSPLMEVFNIIYLGCDKIEQNKQIGTIKVEDGRGVVHHLYKVWREDTSMQHFIQPMDHLVLTGPTGKAICLRLTVVEVGPTTKIQFNLFGGTFVDTLSFEWYGYADVRYEERRILSRNGTGELSVQLGLFANAVEAHVTVELVSNDKSATDIYGAVAASTDLMDDPLFSSILFFAEDKIRVMPGKIPLSRSIVAVPLRSRFFLHIGLFCNVFHDKTLEFNPALDDEQTEIIESCSNCEIKVTVVWVAKRKARAN